MARRTEPLAGKVTIASASGNGRSWHIRLEDESSGTIVTEIDIDEALFGRAIGSQADCTYRTGSDPRLWGATYEHARETVALPDYPTSPAAVEAIPDIRARIEVDGWRIRDDWRNHHRIIDTLEDGTCLYEVMIYRYLDPDGNPIMLEA